jgi:hypothetical protein
VKLKTEISNLFIQHSPLVGRDISVNIPTYNLTVSKINWIKKQISFQFLNCYIGQPSQPVCVKLSSSSCLEPWPHPGKGTLPMAYKAGKLSLEKNGGYTRPKGPFHPFEGQGVNCPLSGPRAPGQPERRSCFHKGSSAAVLCVYALQLNWFLSVCLYSVVHVHSIQ